MVDWFIMVRSFGTDAQSACGCCAEGGGINIRRGERGIIDAGCTGLGAWLRLSGALSMLPGSTLSLALARYIKKSQLRL